MTPQLWEKISSTCTIFFVEVNIVWTSLFMTILFYSCQFEDIGSHGTKIIIYNLWLNDEGIYELSFDDDDEVHCILKMTFHLFAFQYLVSVIPP